MLKNKSITFQKVESSKQDKTKKYIFKLHDGLIMEATYIDNGSDKDIICVSCQTMCTMKCKFCHLTDLIGTIKTRNISPEAILEGVNYINDDLSLRDNNRPLLVSFMGSGEPILNVDGCVKSMIMIKEQYKHSRFGMATILPKKSTNEFFRLTNLVKKYNLDLKMHLSLHFTEDGLRNEWMPNALDIKSSISALEFYKNFTKNLVEIHYTLIEDRNNFDEDINKLMKLVSNKDINVKFLHYKERKTIEDKVPDTSKILNVVNTFKQEGLDAEFYNPPGEDIGSSCGQFLLEKYK